jgi:hypothetical protein
VTRPALLWRAIGVLQLAWWDRNVQSNRPGRMPKQTVFRKRSQARIRRLVQSNRSQGMWKQTVFRLFVALGWARR